MEALHFVSLANGKLGFPEFPSLSVSRLRLSSIGICMQFGAQKLGNLCSSAQQLQPVGQPLGLEQLWLVLTDLQKLCHRHSVQGSVAKGISFSCRSPALLKVKAQRQWDTDTGSICSLGFSLSCGFQFILLCPLHDHSPSWPWPCCPQTRSSTDSLPRIHNFSPSNPYTKSLLQHYSHWFWFTNHVLTGRQDFSKGVGQLRRLTRRNSPKITSMLRV